VTVTLTATPSFTYTVTFTFTRTYTPVNTSTPSFTRTLTLTQTALSTLTFTPTLTATPVLFSDQDLFEIKDTAVYPNPYNQARGNFRVYMNLTKPAVKLVLRVYTVSLRKVMEFEETNGTHYGNYTMNVSSGLFEKLAAGVYFYRLEGESATGEKAFSTASEFIIIKYR
jgi:hypothetical protein